MSRELFPLSKQSCPIEKGHENWAADGPHVPLRHSNSQAVLEMTLLQEKLHRSSAIFTMFETEKNISYKEYFKRFGLLRMLNVHRKIRKKILTRDKFSRRRKLSRRAFPQLFKAKKGWSSPKTERKSFKLIPSACEHKFYEEKIVGIKFAFVILSLNPGETPPRRLLFGGKTNIDFPPTRARCYSKKKKIGSHNSICIKLFIFANDNDFIAVNAAIHGANICGARIKRRHIPRRNNLISRHVIAV